MAYRPEVEVVRDLLADMTRKLHRQIRRLEVTIRTGKLSLSEVRVNRHTISVLEGIVAEHAKILASYEEAERMEKDDLPTNPGHHRAARRPPHGR